MDIAMKVTIVAEYWQFAMRLIWLISEKRIAAAEREIAMKFNYNEKGITEGRVHAAWTPT